MALHISAQSKNVTDFTAHYLHVLHLYKTAAHQFNWTIKRTSHANQNMSPDVQDVQMWVDPQFESKARLPIFEGTQG